MLDASQPWLPLLDLAPVAARPSRRARRLASSAAVPTPARAPGGPPSAPPVSNPALQPAPRADPQPAKPGLPAGEVRALRYAFLGLVARWDLSGREALLLLGEPLDDEAARLERLLALAGVDRSLLLLVPEPERCRTFLRRPCPALEGAAPLALMLTGGRPAIGEVRAHVAALVRV